MSAAPETTYEARESVSAEAGQQGRKWRWVAFGTVVTAAVMDLLDSTIAQVAAPTIRSELGGSYAVIEWVTAAYALAMAVGLLTGGRLGDIFGRRRVLLTGIAGFVLASAACAAAQSAGELIAARAAQGLLGAVMLPPVFGPYGVAAVSPWTKVTSSKLTPISSATIWAMVVAMLCPWLPVPMYPATWPLDSTRMVAA